MRLAELGDGQYPQRDLRYGMDRRSWTRLFLNRRWFIQGRRTAIRRHNDTTGTYLDRYQPGVVLVTIGILIFSGLDATLTLILLAKGTATEANPLMRVLIERDIQLFVNVKMFITAFALLLLAMHAHFTLFKKIRVKQVMRGLLGFYAALVGYELIMLILPSMT